MKKGIDGEYTVSKVEDFSKIDLDREMTFIENTIDEKSLVCKTQYVPSNTTEREDGWIAFRVEGPLDFSLIGILSRISETLASNGIPIFAISTYDTDYIFIKKEMKERAVKALLEDGFEIN